MIAEGHDADLVIWDPAREFIVDAGALQHRHKLTAYHGRTLKGVVRKTFLRGMKVYHDGKLPAQPAGVLIMRES
jgi:allantoinase